MSVGEAVAARARAERRVLRLPRSAGAREALAICFVLGVAALALWPLAFGDQLPRATDTDAFYGPLGSFLHRSLARGDLPLWAPGAFGGQPFAADAQSGVLYPPTLLAFWGLQPAEALRVVALFHYAIAALGTYAFVRLLGCRRFPAVYAALAYALSGHLLARASMLGLLAGVAWLPVTLAAAELVARSRRRRAPAAVLLAVALALDLLAGSQQLAVIAVIACGLWLLLRAGPRGAAWLAVSVAGAAGLAAVAVLPRLEFLRLSTSNGGVVDPSGIGSLVWGDARALVGGLGVGHSEVTSLYVGALTPALALVALALRRPRSGALGALALFALVWATGLAGWLLQPFGSLHAIAAHEPVRAMALFVLALAALAALALDRLPREGRILLLGLGALVLALVLGPRQALAPAFLVSLAAIAGVLVLLRSRLIPAVLAIPLVCLVLAGDLAWHGYYHGAGAVWQPASQATPQPAGSAAFLLARQAREGAFRVASVAPTSLLVHQLGHARSDVARALLLDQEAMRVGLEDVSGYNPVHLAAYDRTMLASNAGVAAERHFELALRAPTPQLRALAVRYYVSAPGHSPRGLPVVYRDALSEVSEDPLALPLARVLRAHGTTPARVVVRSPDRVVVAVAGTAAGRLVLADQAYPGWVVRVDGRTAHARTTADGLRAVDVPAGSHRVSWTFEPRSLRIGLLVTLASAALLALVAAAALRRRP